jgi:hypothetical protein
MAYSAKHLKQLVVFGDGLLGMGALLGVTSDPRDVAERIFSRFENMDGDGRLLGPDMLPLTKMHVSVNHEVANHLGLIVPEQLADSR